MKRSTVFALILGALFVGALVAYATVAQTGGNGSAEAWLAAQRQTPALWALDAAALYTLLLSASYGSQSARLRAGKTQIDRLHDEHRAQLEAMLANTENAEEVNAAQADQITMQAEKIAARDEMIATQVEKIAAHEETIRSLTAQAAALQQEIDARQEAFETEARRMTEQVFRALAGQVDANARQLDAVNLALQYHRAEIQQLRHGLRAVLPGSDPARIARLTPAELAAITAQNIGVLSPDADGEGLPVSDTVADDTPAPATAAPQKAATPSDIELPTSEDPESLWGAEHPMPNTRSPQSENAPATVIMETIHFKLVPELTPGEDLTELPAQTQSAPVDDIDAEQELEQGLAVVPEHNEVPASSASADIVTREEFCALVSPLPDQSSAFPPCGEEVSQHEAAHLSSALSELRLSRWQRTL